MRTKRNGEVFKRENDFYVKDYWGEIKINKEYAVTLLKEDYNSYEICKEFPDLEVQTKIK